MSEFGVPQVVPLPPPVLPGAVPPGKPRRWWLWIIGGCGTLGFLAVIGVVALVIVTMNSGGKNAGVPADFPVYPAARTLGFHTFFGTDGNTIDVVYGTSADAATVTEYYHVNLNEGHWTVTSQAGTCGCLEFKRDDGMLGRLRVLGTGTTSEVDVQFHKK
jgi:hypothetical protein